MPNEHRTADPKPGDPEWPIVYRYFNADTGREVTKDEWNKLPKGTALRGVMDGPPRYRGCAMAYSFRGFPTPERVKVLAGWL